MKTVKIKDIDIVEHIKNEYDHLDRQVCFLQSHSHDLRVSYLYKDILQQEDDWKYMLLAACSVMGLLERNKIKAQLQLPNKICVDNQMIARVFVESINDDLKGIVVTVWLNVNDSQGNICMKDITKRTYNMTVLLTGLTAFMNIYDNLYRTHEFYKVLEYVNSIICGKKVDDLNYGEVTFLKLDNDGQLQFIDHQGTTHHQHINEMEKEKC